MEGEFILNDLVACEKKLERLSDERRKGGGRDKALIDREIELFGRLRGTLEEEKPLRGLTLTADEEKTISGYGLLSRKPVLILVNLDETQPVPVISYRQDQTRIDFFRAKIEMELAQMAPEDAAIFMNEYGIAELGLDRVIRLSYDLLDQMSFFTAGEDECRAWTVRKNATAPEAAGVIHTDLQKGFIRAEVLAYDDLMTLGSYAEAKAKGKLRLEGKEYRVKDGDILNIRFNVSK